MPRFGEGEAPAEPRFNTKPDEPMPGGRGAPRAAFAVLRGFPSLAPKPNPGYLSVNGLRPKNIFVASVACSRCRARRARSFRSCGNDNLRLVLRRDAARRAGAVLIAAGLATHSVALRHRYTGTAAGINTVGKRWASRGLPFPQNARLPAPPQSDPSDPSDPSDWL